MGGKKDADRRLFDRILTPGGVRVRFYDPYCFKEVLICMKSVFVK